jgi:hypothetical protein
MTDGIRIVGWFLCGLMGAVLLIHVWALTRSRDPGNALLPGARSQTWLYVAILIQSLNIALGYRSDLLSWLLLVAQGTCLLIFMIKLRPRFIQHLRDVGLMSDKKK